MRVVSLVPSATETLLALGVQPVGVTRFCECPGVVTVGGTKDPDVDAILGLAPDLVVVNDEENRSEDADRMAAAGLRLHAMSPRSVTDVGPAVQALAGAVGVAAPAPFGPDEWVAVVGARPEPRASAFVAVWRRPWMSLSAATYGASILAWCGVRTLFADAPDRYPEVTLAAVAEHRPDLVLLPDEPYPFSSRHVAEIEAGVPSARVVLVDGRDLFWWGVRTPVALARLRTTLATVERR